MPGPPQCLLNGNYYSSTEPPTENPHSWSHPFSPVHTYFVCHTHVFQPIWCAHIHSIFLHQLLVFVTYLFMQHQMAGLVPALVEQSSPHDFLCHCHTHMHEHTHTHTLDCWDPCP